jgi:sulfonate transport system substrate-binding protein
MGGIMRAKFIVAAAVAIATVSATAQAEPFKIRLSFIVPVSNWATMLFQHKENAKHLGQSYTFEAVRYRGTPDLVSALNAGELELANMGYTTLPTAILNAGMTDLRIVADELQDGVPGYYSNEFMVRKDSDIHKWEDLKGHVIATSVFGGGTDIPLRVILKAHGLEDKKNITIIETPIPTMPAMLADKKVDLIVLPLPFSANPKVREATRTIGTTGEAIGPNALGMWVSRTGVIEKNRAAMLDFMEDALRDERWYYDPKNHDEAVKIAMNVTKLPAEVWNSWLFKKDGQNGDYYRAPNGILDMAALQKTVDLQHEFGFIKQTFDVNKYADFSLMKEAAERLAKEK